MDAEYPQNTLWWAVEYIIIDSGPILRTLEKNYPPYQDSLLEKRHVSRCIRQASQWEYL